MDKLIPRELLEPIATEIEKLILDKAAGLVNFYCGTLVTVVRAMERQYGKEAGRIAREAFLRWHDDSYQAAFAGIEDRSVQAWANRIQRNGAGTNASEREIDEPNHVRLKVTRCLFAEEFLRLGAPDIAEWLCATDEPAAKAFNPKIEFRITRTIADGDGFCDHEWRLPPPRDS